MTGLGSTLAASAPAPGPADAEGPPTVTSAERPAEGAHQSPSRESERRETEVERLDRNQEEMTGELRVIVTGVQVLFAFLLIVPFNTGFANVGSFEQAVYFVTLLLAALSAACMIAPSAQHRILFRHYDKGRLMFVSNRIVIAGLVFLALAMCGAVLLVASKLFGAAAGILTLLAVATPFAVLWFGMPLRRRAELDRARRPSRPQIRSAGDDGRAAYLR